MAALPVGRVFTLVAPGAPLDDAVLERIEPDTLVRHHGAVLRAVELLLHVVGEVLVQPLHVHRVQGVLHDLQPVARDH
jgi:hypothetical protein